MEPIDVTFTPNDKNALDDLINAIDNIPTPTMREYYNNMHNRELWIDTVICEECETLKIAKHIINFNREDIGIPIKDRKPIILYINSPGGDANLCYTLIDVIRASKTPVWGVNLGLCCSSAAYIFINCHKRFMFNNGSLLFHKGYGALEGNASEIEEHFKSYQKNVDKLSEVIKDCTKYTRKEIKSNIEKEWYVYSDEALKKCACDIIISSLDEIFNINDKKQIKK